MEKCWIINSSFHRSTLHPSNGDPSSIVLTGIGLVNHIDKDGEKEFNNKNCEISVDTWSIGVDISILLASIERDAVLFNTPPNVIL